MRRTWFHAHLQQSPDGLLHMADVTDTLYAGEAFIGYKAQLKVAQDTSPDSLVAVADVTSIKFGNTPATIINKTHLRSPGRTQEKMSTFRDLGPFTIMGNYRPTHGSHKLTGGDGFSASKSLPSLHRSQAENNFQVSFLDADDNLIEIDFAGVVADYQIGDLTVENKVDFTASIQPLSDWTDGLP